MKSLKYYSHLIIFFVLISCGNDTISVDDVKKDEEKIKVEKLERLLEQPPQSKSFKSTINSMLAMFSPEQQSFTIDPTQPQTITGNQGTIIKFPKNIFQFKNGEQPNLPIEIQLLECYSYKDMISQNLHTQSNNQLLETGGMIKVEAKQGDQFLELKANQSYTIQFPKEGEEAKPMEIFYRTELTDSTFTWDNTTESELYLSTALITFHPIYKETMRIDAYEIKFYIDPEFISLQFIQSNSDAVTYFTDSKNLPPLDVLQFFSDSNCCPHFSFQINKQGQIDNLQPLLEENNPLQKRVNDLFLPYIQNLPKIDFTTVDLDEFAFKICFDKNPTVNEINKKDLDKNINNLDKKQLESYVLNSTQMGWINCDWFYNIDNIERINYSVKSPFKNLSKVYLIFKDFNTIIQGDYKNGYFVFNNIPNNTPVKLVGFTYKNGKPFLSVSEVKTSSYPQGLGNFKPFSFKELNQALSNLD